MEFLVDAFRTVGENYLNESSSHTKEETKEILYRIASIIFSKETGEENLGYLNSILEEDVFHGCVIRSKERKIVSNPVSVPSSKVRISPELYKFNNFILVGVL